MARQKFLNLDFRFKKKNTNKKITVDNQEIDENFSKTVALSSVNEKIEFEIDGFTHQEPDSYISISVMFNGKELNMHGLGNMFVRNNKFVNDHCLSFNGNAYLNGTLQFKFCQDWFKHIVFNGMCGIDIHTKAFTGTTKKDNDQYDSLRQHDLDSYDIGCFGASYTHGTDLLKRSDTWPGVLARLTNKKVANFGVEGIDHYSNWCNIDYLLDKIKLEHVINLVPVNKFLPYRVNFLDAKVNLMVSTQVKAHEMYKQGIEKWMRQCIVYENKVNTLLQNKMKKVREKCKNLGTKLTLIYQRSDEKNNIYGSESTMDFYFPTFNENDTVDGYHPVAGVHESFARNIFKSL